MADYDKLIARYPAMSEFIRAQRAIRYRGEVLTYPQNVKADSFSTDEAGFRHSTFRGNTFSVGDCLRSERYGVLLGASNNFGFGLAGNENTLASRLAERLGFPFANAALPGGNSRNLHSLLVAFFAKAPRRPAVVVHSSGGDLATFCNSSLADPVFGSPNRAQRQGPLRERSLRADPERNVKHMLAFTTLWTGAIARLCRANRVPLVLIHQSTFFEKSKPSESERAMGLGQPFRDWQEREFANHRKFNQPFFDQRKKVAERLGVPLAGWGLTDRLTFLDEFHCDADGVAVLGEAIADAVEPLLEAEPIDAKAGRK